MRVLWITTSASFDGPGRILAALMRHWPASDQVLVCTLGRATEDFHRAAPAGVTIRELGARRYWDIRAITGLPGVFRAFRPDLVHTHLSRADWIGGPTARLFGVPVVSTVHNLHSRMYRADYPTPRAWIGTALDRLTRPSFDRFIAVSGGVRADIERSGVASDRITVIRNGIDLDRLESALPRARAREVIQAGGDAETIVVGTVALLKPQKGIPFLIEAAKAVVARDRRVRFVHIGDGPLDAEIAAAVAAAGLGDRFRLLGRMDDPMAAMRGLDMFVLPSLWEGLPIALLEAMATGLACVGTRVSGIEEVIEHEKSGLLVSAADPAALAEAILTLAGSPERREALGAAARARVGREFDSRRMADAYREVYFAEVLERRRQGATARSITTRPPSDPW